MTHAAGFAPLIDMFASAEQIADRYGLTDPQLRDAFRRQVVMSLAGAYLEGCATTVENPDWVPYIPYYLPRSGPNPDSTYKFAPVEPHGVYRLEGAVGTEIIATVTLRQGGAHLGRRCTGRVDEIDLLSLPRDAAGRFSFILSAERPEGYDGAWFHLAPQTECLMLRHVTKTADQTEGHCGLERLDRAAGAIAPAPGEVGERMQRMAEYVLAQVEFLPGYLEKIRAMGADKDFVVDEQSEYGGLVSQLYHFYLFDLEPGEALVLEADVPEACEYWSVQLMDPFSRTIDYALHQASLNDAQAVVDADGRTRCVIALEDPGVPNWLDPASWGKGAVIWRWASRSHDPTPSVRRVKLAELATAVPGGRSFTPEQRRETMRARAAFYQSRRR